MIENRMNVLYYTQMVPLERRTVYDGSVDIRSDSPAGLGGAGGASGLPPPIEPPLLDPFAIARIRAAVELLRAPTLPERPLPPLSFEPVESGERRDDAPAPKPPLPSLLNGERSETMALTRCIRARSSFNASGFGAVRAPAAAAPARARSRFLAAAIAALHSLA